MKKILSCAVLTIAVLTQGGAFAADAPAAAPAAAPPAKVGKPRMAEAAAVVAPVLGDKAGNMVPEWTAPMVGGEAVTSAKLKGKSYGIVFVNNSCTSCRAELGDLQQMKFKEGFTLYVAAVDARLDRALSTYKDEMKITFPILDDSKFQVAGKFGIASTPALAIVDKDGKVEYWVAGYTAESKELTIAAFDKHVMK